MSIGPILIYILKLSNFLPNIVKIHKLPMYTHFFPTSSVTILLPGQNNSHLFLVSKLSLFFSLFCRNHSGCNEVVSDAVTPLALGSVDLYRVSKLGGNTSPQLSERETVTVCGEFFLKLPDLRRSCPDMLHRCRLEFLIVYILAHGHRVPLIRPGGIHITVCNIRNAP